MRQTYPGQMPAARLNLFNVVLVLDFSQPGSLYYIANTISNIIQRGNPIRFGVVPMVGQGERKEEGERMARLIWYLVDRYGRAKTMGFLKAVSVLLCSMFCSLAARNIRTNDCVAAASYRSSNSQDPPRISPTTSTGHSSNLNSNHSTSNSRHLTEPLAYRTTPSSILIPTPARAKVMAKERK